MEDIALPACRLPLRLRNSLGEHVLCLGHQLSPVRRPWKVLHACGGLGRQVDHGEVLHVARVVCSLDLDFGLHRFRIPPGFRCSWQEEHTDRCTCDGDDSGVGLRGCICLRELGHGENIEGRTGRPVPHAEGEAGRWKHHLFLGPLTGCRHDCYPGTGHPLGRETLGQRVVSEQLRLLGSQCGRLQQRSLLLLLHIRGLCRLGQLDVGVGGFYQHHAGLACGKGYSAVLRNSPCDC
mmetsp:Transcript_78293/g.162639  ORF Transcript_78293/g.162639 Transcript_78293/m.162639 type:complete len:236 (-) Transcript_78293:587-1294(-)